MARQHSNKLGHAIPAQLERLQRTRRLAAELAEQMRAAGTDGEWWTEEVGPDHPLAKAFGHEAALAMIAKARAATEKPSRPSGLSRRDRSRRAERRLADVKAMSQQGRSVDEIARVLGISSGYVVQLRAKLGLGRQLRDLRAAQHRDDVQRMSQAGQSVRQIARALGLSYYYVVQLRREAGVSTPRSRR